MNSCLVINSGPTEVRAALLENDVPVEVHIERRAERGVVGNIYRGKVVRVLPGMQAAFVEIGLERTGFLYVDDALPRAAKTSSDDESQTEGEVAAPSGFRSAPLANIGDVLKQGQELLVQVQKEPLGTKGARLTRHVNLPGRNLVYMPFAEHLGVSHRISQPEERERLRSVLTEVQPEGAGFIVRTAAEGLDSAELQREARMLVQMWQDIEERGSRGACPRLVFEDLDLALRITRDFFTEDVSKVVCDSAADVERIKEFVRSFTHGDEHRVALHQETTPLFDHYGIEIAIDRALERRVWLKSGGYVVIDQAEALTVVDVNSGRYVGKSNLEDTITQINLEAVKEIAYQLRLRNIGGIIIVDFIDMVKADNREKVHVALAEALKRDKAKSTIVRMSEIGLVEMTRKRVRDSLGHTLTEPCSYCKGKSFIKSEASVAHDILRAIARKVSRDPAHQVLVNMQPQVADYLYEALGSDIEETERLYKTRIIPVAREGYHREHFEIVAAREAK